MIGEVAFVEVAAFGQIEFAHLPVRHIDAAYLDRHDAGTDLESEVAVDFAAYRTNERNLVANGFDIFELVFTFLPARCPPACMLV